jgi:hypothetical protein
MERTTIVQGRYQRPRVDAIPLGGHLDDWIDDGLVLTRALTMGYPSVPLSSRSQLIASIGEVNGVIDRYDRPFVHFAVSTMGRGGFSGGPVISEYGFLLGVYTGMFSENFSATGGLPGVLSVEPLLNLLHENGIYPGNTNDPFLRELYSGLDKPLEEILSSPNVTVEGNAEALIGLIAGSALISLRNELPIRATSRLPRRTPAEREVAYLSVAGYAANRSTPINPRRAAAALDPAAALLPPPEREADHPLLQLQSPARSGAPQGPAKCR